MRKILIIPLLLCVLFTSFACKKEEKCDGFNHTQSDWIVTTEATCSQEGSEHRICTICSEEISIRTIAKTEHTVALDQEVLPTCTEDGKTSGSHCEVCNTVIVAQEVVPATGHSYLLSPELSNEQYLVYKCKNCDEQYSVENTSQETCANGHTEGSWTTIYEATCSTQGQRQKVCTECGIVLEIQDIPLISHTVVVDEAVEATCSHTGLTEGSHCAVCEKVIVAQVVVPTLEHQYTLTNTKNPTTTEEGYLEYTCSICNEKYQTILEVIADYDDSKATTIILSDSGTIVTNNNGGVVIDGDNINIILAGEYDISGTLSEGSITITLGEDDKATINLLGVNITSTKTNPIYIVEGDKVEISAKSGYKNYIYDNRPQDSSTDATGAAIFSEIDLEIKGKGELNIISTYNNGLASKDDLEIKNLTLYVKAINNAIKGNDSLTIESGNITAISTTNDALKTTNSDVSSKGNQRGIITINDGIINLYAACDGIDAAYDVIINGGTINIYTDSYSEYSSEVTVTNTKTMYVTYSQRVNLSSYTISGKFISEDGTVTWKNATLVSSGYSRYYTIEMESSAKYVKFFAYTASQTAGQETTYAYCSDQLTIPSTYDTYYVSSLSSSKLMSGSWRNFTTNQGGGFRPGGGMDEGNSDAALYSCKGIKADNEISITGGTILVKSHDDALHANYDTLLETNSYGTGNVTISGGTLDLSSDDDGIHADGTLTIKSGTITIQKSYEGLEGDYININGGTTQLKASDDSVNAKVALNITDGLLYLDANGDGLDANGTITMSGGTVLALGPTNSGNGVLDFDRSFTFSGGLLLAIGCQGMNQRPTASSGNTATTSSISTNTSSYVSVTVNNEIVATIKVTKQSQSYCVLAYNNTAYPSAKVSVSTSNSNTLVNGLYYVK